MTDKQQKTQRLWGLYCKATELYQIQPTSENKAAMDKAYGEWKTSRWPD